MPNLEDAAQVAERASENARKRVADFAGNQEAQIKFYALESFGRLIAADIRKLQNGDGEIERLERAVIEAAIEWRGSKESDAQATKRLQRLWDATNTLIAAREER